MNQEFKKGSMELLILAVLEDRPRHGYDIAKLIGSRSEGVVRFRSASLYPRLYRMENKGWIRGRWVEKAGQRRRRYYRLTSAGRVALRKQREGWLEFVQALNRVAVDHA